MNHRVHRGHRVHLRILKDKRTLLSSVYSVNSVVKVVC
jgi:hypothetical protein